MNWASFERTHHDGNGSNWFRLVIREPSEWVSWTRRWRDCSRVFIWSGDGVVIFNPFLPSFPGSPIFGVSRSDSLDRLMVDMAWA